MHKPTQIKKVNQFLKNEDELLNLARIARTKHVAPSEILKITDELTAFEFDAVCTYVYHEFEKRCDVARLEAQLQGISRIFGGAPGETDETGAETW